MKAGRRIKEVILIAILLAVCYLIDKTLNRH